MAIRLVLDGGGVERSHRMLSAQEEALLRHLGDVTVGGEVLHQGTVQHPKTRQAQGRRPEKWKDLPSIADWRRNRMVALTRKMQPATVLVLDFDRKDEDPSQEALSTAVSLKLAELPPGWTYVIASRTTGFQVVYCIDSVSWSMAKRLNKWAAGKWGSDPGFTLGLSWNPLHSEAPDRGLTWWANGDGSPASTLALPVLSVHELFPELTDGVPEHAASPLEARAGPAYLDYGRRGDSIRLFRESAAGQRHSAFRKAVGRISTAMLEENHKVDAAEVAAACVALNASHPFPLPDDEVRDLINWATENNMRRSKDFSSAQYRRGSRGRTKQHNRAKREYWLVRDMKDYLTAWGGPTGPANTDEMGRLRRANVDLDRIVDMNDNCRAASWTGKWASNAHVAACLGKNEKQVKNILQRGKKYQGQSRAPKPLTLDETSSSPQVYRLRFWSGRQRIDATTSAVTVTTRMPTRVFQTTRAVNAYGGTGCTIVGTVKADKVTLKRPDGVVCAGPGSDQVSVTAIGAVYAGTGNDVVDASTAPLPTSYKKVRLDGGYGNDRLLGSIGEDTLVGQAGDDFIAGNGGGDWIYGDRVSMTPDAPIVGVVTRYDDTIDTGATGRPWVYAGPGNDRITSYGAGSVHGGLGGDKINSKSSAGEIGYYLDGDRGDDDIIDGPGSGSISGNAGSDRLIGGAGDDSIHGEEVGKGAAQYEGDTYNDVIDSGPGNDGVYGDRGNDVITDRHQHRARCCLRRLRQ